MKQLRNNQGFTLVELMIVVAIIGILAAIAIPQYLNYMAQSRLNACQANFDTAHNLVKAEVAKQAAGAATVASLTGALNEGNKRDPYNAANAAFALAAGAVNECVTVIDQDTIPVPATPAPTVVITSGGMNGAQAVTVTVE